ncbi:MAG: alpha/beta fold hydrolase [Gammaproteobacteria bacterium]|nr:alpha/beta fold hydrolase [Gammaproteobacteria bacterium]
MTRAGLRTLAFSGLSVASAAEHDYFAFYGIDFANRIAGESPFRAHRGSGLPHRLSLLPAAEGARNPHFAARLFDHAGLYGHLIEHCLNSGRNVLIWDLPGHGLSSGPQASIHSFEDYTDVLEAMLELHGAELPRPLWAIGQSTGGAILMSWAFRKCRSPAACPFERMMLLAPLVRPARWHRVKLLHTLLHRVRNNLGRSFVRNSSDDEFLDFVRVDPLQSRILSIRWVSAMRQWIRRVRRSCRDRLRATGGAGNG